MKKVLLWLLVISMVAVFSFAGCKSAEAAEETAEAAEETAEAAEETAEAAEETAEDITLNVICMRSADQEAAMAAIPQFEQETGIKVNVSYFTWNDMMSTEKMDFTTGGGGYDIVTGTAYPLSEFVAAGWIMPIDEFINDSSLEDPKIDDIFPAILEDACMRGGAIYGLPMTVYANMFGYREDLYIENGIVDDEGNAKPPETYIEMRENAIKLTQDTDGDGEIDQYGQALFCVKGDPLTYDLGPYLWAYGSEFVNTDTMRAGFMTPEGMEALSLYANLILKDKVTPPGVLGYAHAEFIDAMRTGLTAQGVFFQEAVGLPMDDPNESQVVGKIAYALSPGVEMSDGSIKRYSHVGAFSLFINKDSKNPEAAYKFIQFVTSQEQAKDRLMLGGKPYRVSDFEIQEVLDEYPYFEILKESLAIGRYIPQLPEWRTVVEIFIKNYHGALSGTVELEASMAEAAAEIDAVLEMSYQ